MIKKIGATVVRVTTYEGTAMRKHGSERQQPKDDVLSALDAVASRKVAPMGVHGLVVRKRVT